MKIKKPKSPKVIKLPVPKVSKTKIIPDLFTGQGDPELIENNRRYAEDAGSGLVEVRREIEAALEIVAKVLRERVSPVKKLDPRSGREIEIQTAELTRDLCSVAKTLGFLKALYSVGEQSSKGGTMSYEDFIKMASGD